MKSQGITLCFGKDYIFLNFHWNTKWHNQRNLQMGLSLIKLSYFYLKLLFTFVQLVLDDPVKYKLSSSTGHMAAEWSEEWAISTDP